MRTAERIVGTVDHTHGYSGGVWKAARASFCLFSLVSLAACIHDKAEVCPTGIDARFVSVSPCGDEQTLPESDDLRLYLFDESGVFVEMHTDEGAAIGDPDFRRRVDAAPGTYSILAWTGLDGGPYDLETPEPGVTTKEDLLFKLRRTAQDADDHDGSRVWFGESDDVTLTGADKGSVYTSVEIDLQEVTNRVTVVVTGLDVVDYYEIIVEQNNGAMEYDAVLAPDETLRHRGVRELDREGLSHRFTTLTLTEDRTNTLIVERTDGTQVLFNDDLLGDLLLEVPDTNFACRHDFLVTLQAEAVDGTWMIVEATVNGWSVYKYSTYI